MTRTLWTVSHSDSDVDMTVIAETARDACEMAREYDNGPGESWAEYDAKPDSCILATGLRWVGYDSRTDRDATVADLATAGVNLSRVQVRDLRDGFDRALLWEVGCRDEDWCRLPAGVLCGGEQ